MTSQKIKKIIPLPLLTEGPQYGDVIQKYLTTWSCNGFCNQMPFYDPIYTFQITYLLIYGFIN